MHYARNELPSILLSIFPGYYGTKFQVKPVTSVTVTDTQWSGGTRYTWKYVNLLNGAFLPIKGDGYSPLMENYCFAVHKFFQGDDLGITFYVHPSNMNMLVRHKVELTTDEQIVLVVTKSCKSSYGGIKDFRFHEAHRQYGIERGPWLAAIESCIKKGLLRSNKSLTPAGRNAVES